MTDKQRKAFERFAKNSGWELSYDQIRFSDDETIYKYENTRLAYEAFLAGIKYAKKEAVK